MLSHAKKSYLKYASCNVIIVIFPVKGGLYRGKLIPIRVLPSNVKEIVIAINNNNKVNVL